MHKKIKTSKSDVVLKIVAYVFITAFAIFCFYPLLMTLSVSFSSNSAINRNGYSAIPQDFSLDTYIYIFGHSGVSILKSYGVTIFVTVVGTLSAMLITSMMSFALSINSLKYRNVIAFVCDFTIIFYAGLIPWYVACTKYYGLGNNIWSLIVPSIFSVWIMFLLRTYFKSVPLSLYEAARIDGAGDFRCYWQIVMPMCIPVIATIALFLAVIYWNDWYTGFLYIIQNDDIVPIQLLLKRIENNIQYLSNAASTGMSGIEIQMLNETLPEESVKMALVVMVTTPILISYPFFQKYFINGITIGSVKE